jgi:hypothetical protein
MGGTAENLDFFEAGLLTTAVGYNYNNHDIHNFHHHRLRSLRNE